MVRTLKVVVQLLPAALLVVTAAAQDVEPEAVVADTVVYPVWEHDLSATLSGSQAGYKRWTEGGINSLAATSQVLGTFVRTSDSWLQTYELRLGIGILKQDTLAVRKAEDALRLKGQVSYTGDGKFHSFSPTVAVGLRTQFAPGFNYTKNPFEDGRNPPVKVSDFFSPATFTQSLGMGFHSDFTFSQRLGIAAKETVILIERFRPVYGQVPSESVRLQLGIESHTEVDREVFSNVQVKSTLGLFAAFNQDELPDALWENAVLMKVNDWLSTNLEVVALYDRDISDAVQIKEVFSVGISIVIM
jgi:hypothetical protein